MGETPKPRSEPSDMGETPKPRSEPSDMGGDAHATLGTARRGTGVSPVGFEAKGIQLLALQPEELDRLLRC